MKKRSLDTGYSEITRQRLKRERLDAAYREITNAGLRKQIIKLVNSGTDVFTVDKIMANYELYDGRVVFTTKDHGAILLDDEMWHPFRYFENGDLDIGDDAVCKPSSALKMAELSYT